MSRHLLKVILLSGTVLVTSCGTLEPAPNDGSVPIETQPDYTQVQKPVTPVQPTAPQRPPVVGAAQTLMARAGNVAAAQDYEQALALLERAQRIDPDSAEIYLSLAKTYKAKGDFSMATAAAERGMLYCRGSAQCDALRAYIR